MVCCPQHQPYLTAVHFQGEIIHSHHWPEGLSQPLDHHRQARLQIRRHRLNVLIVPSAVFLAPSIAIRHVRTRGSPVLGLEQKVPANASIYNFTIQYILILDCAEVILGIRLCLVD